MRRIMQLLLVITLLGSITACNTGNNNNDQKKEDTQSGEVKNETTNNNNDQANEDDQAEMQAKLDEGYFSEVDIEFTYADDKEYTAEIDKDDGRIKAKIENDLNGEQIKGKEAFDLIFGKMENLNITSTSDEQEVIKQILQEFDLPTDYEEVDIEVKFHDGEKFDIEERRGQ